MSFLSLTEQDREQMLDTIGVDSIEELFEQIPEGVRLGADVVSVQWVADLEAKRVARPEAGRRRAALEDTIP